MTKTRTVKSKKANANDDAGRIRSITGLLSLLRKSARHNVVAWFRGQSDATWRLLPTLARNAAHLEAEIDLIARFKQHSALLVGHPPSTEWQWITIMQHHGVPTRLLDWTENPLIGL